METSITHKNDSNNNSNLEIETEWINKIDSFTVNSPQAESKLLSILNKKIKKEKEKKNKKESHQEEVEKITNNLYNELEYNSDDSNDSVNFMKFF